MLFRSSFFPICPTLYPLRGGCWLQVVKTKGQRVTVRALTLEHRQPRYLISFELMRPEALRHCFAAGLPTEPRELYLRSGAINKGLRHKTQRVAGRRHRSRTHVAHRRQTHDVISRFARERLESLEKQAPRRRGARRPDPHARKALRPR